MTQTPWLAFSINRGSKTPVFEQICESIRTRVISGDLEKGSRLPATRVFAAELGLSRSTVVTAYEQLVAEGYLSSTQGSGFTVCNIGEVELAGQQAGTRHQEEPEETVLPPVPFEASQPDMRLFPHRQWARAVARVCRANPQAMLVGGASFGNVDLRKAIAAHVAEWRGIEASPDQIIVTAGSADALEICMRSLTGKEDVIGLENPGYVPVRHFAGAHGLIPAFLNVDDQGAELPHGDTKPRLVILTPSHQYPLGGAMSPNRRLEFIRWAERHDSWIVEDDYDSEFRYAGRPIPAMAGFDRLNRTIYVGSFSKIFSNALRLGYIIVPEPLAEPFRATVERSGLKASYMPQQALAEFMSSGEFYRHLRRVRRIYAERRRYLLDRLLQSFGDYGRFHDHQAGMQIVFHLKDRFDDVGICRRASEQGVRVRALSEFAISGSGLNGLILGFCGYSETEMEVSLDALKACFVADQAGR